MATGCSANCMGRDQWRRSHHSQREELRLPHSDRFHDALRNAYGAALADHRDGPGYQLLGFAVDRASHRELSICRWTSALLFHRNAQDIGQRSSTVEGFYRQYTLIYVVADERDCIRLRTNYRREDVYLYHTLASPAQARERFREYINTVNALHENPRWYNAVTSNCTTSIRTQRAANLRKPWDWRILLNGKADEMLYQDHAIATGGLSFHRIETAQPDRRTRARRGPGSRFLEHYPGGFTAERLANRETNVPSSSFTLPRRSSIAI